MAKGWKNNLTIWFCWSSAIFIDSPLGEGWLHSCDQSYKDSMIVIYHSRVIPDLKIPHITTLELLITSLNWPLSSNPCTSLSFHVCNIRFPNHPILFSGLFFSIFLFSTDSIKYVHFKISLMTGFELQSSGFAGILLCQLSHNYYPEILDITLLNYWSKLFFGF